MAARLRDERRLPGQLRDLGRAQLRGGQADQGREFIPAALALFSDLKVVAESENTRSLLADLDQGARLSSRLFGYDLGMPHTTIRTADGTQLKAYLAVPAAAGPHPGVVVVQDALGLTGPIREHTDRLASYGYLTVAPDLYTRGGMLRCVQATVRSLFKGEGQAYDDIETARRWLLSRDDCSGRVGVIGFCMGGGFALMTASRGFDVAAPNYGALPKNLDTALNGACPVVGSYGARDRTLKGAAAKLTAALTERDVPHDVKEYPDAGHSFLEQFPVGPLAPVLRVAGLGYEAASATDAWQRIRAFFDEHLADSERPEAG